MAVSTTPNNALTTIKQLERAFPDILFKEGIRFQWSPQQQVVSYQSLKTLEDVCILLHETAHAFLGHSDFQNDISLLQREIEAWEYASTTLAAVASLVIPAEVVERHLETYRSWLHLRSRCPTCGHSGLQTREYIYKCINCQTKWKVNDARSCQLRRYRLPSN